MAKNSEMKVLSRRHFFDLLDKGQEEFRIETVTPGTSNKRTISEDAPFDKDDPMSYVLVDIVFDYVTIYAKGEFSAHDIAESNRVYGNQNEMSMRQRLEMMEKTVKELQAQLASLLPTQATV